MMIGNSPVLMNTNDNILPLAGHDASHGQSTYEITRISKIVKFMQKCNERLVFKPFLIPMIQNINVETHLVLVGNRNSLWNTR